MNKKKFFNFIENKNTTKNSNNKNDVNSSDKSATPSKTAPDPVRKKRTKLVIILATTALIIAGFSVWTYIATTPNPMISSLVTPDKNSKKIFFGDINSKYYIDENSNISITRLSQHAVSFNVENGNVFFGNNFRFGATVFINESDKDLYFKLSGNDNVTQYVINNTTGNIHKFNSNSQIEKTPEFRIKKLAGIYTSSAYSAPFNPLSLLTGGLPLFLLWIFIMYFFLRKSMGMGNADGESIFSIGKTQAKLVNTNVKFSDVAGIEEEKFELMEIVDYLKNPQKYKIMGARTPKGIILYGPPGTGKTLLARAVAGEANVPFFQASGSMFDDMLVGVGAKRVRDLFSKASKSAPSIIFIDEIDSVASKRGKSTINGGGLADQTINQLLAEMDGFSTNSGVIVMAATNRLDVLDPAILRPGRFDRQIQVNLPDIKERVEILKIHSKNKNISDSVDLEDIARKTPGFSGAQLENVLNEATLLAVREDKKIIDDRLLDEAIDRVIAGPAKQNKVISQEEKKQIAFHEAGHALVGLYLEGADVVEKITIIPRGNAAGYTVSVPEKQELAIKTKSDLLGMVAATLGGRAAEEVIYGADKVSTGAANDLYKVTNIVRAMVTQLGMSSIGLTQFYPSEGEINPYNQKLFSDETGLLIDKEIDKIIKEQYKKALTIIKENSVELKLIVNSLLILETITRKQIYYIHKNLKLPKEVIEKSKKIISEKDKKKDKSEKD